MTKSITFIIAILFSLSTAAQSNWPIYDTTRGVVVFYAWNDLTEDFDIKADSAILIMRADKTICEQYKMIDCGNCFNCGYENPYWYEWRIILFRRGNLGIPVRQKISFSPNAR